MTWDLFNIIGTIAFALSGVIVAMEEEYDLMGVYILGLVTAFGGGAIRNLLIGVPISVLWDQGNLFFIAISVMTIAFIIPNLWIVPWLKWGIFFDAIGLGAFAIQGALYAVELNQPLSAAIVAATLTGTGGGMIRDLLAGRKPLFLHKEIYIAWAMLAGIVIGLGLVTSMTGYLILLVVIIILRMLSVQFHWQLPQRKLKAREKDYNDSFF